MACISASVAMFISTDVVTLHCNASTRDNRNGGTYKLMFASSSLACIKNEPKSVNMVCRLPLQGSGPEFQLQATNKKLAQVAVIRPCFATLIFLAMVTLDSFRVVDLRQDAGEVSSCSHRSIETITPEFKHAVIGRLISIEPRR